MKVYWKIKCPKCKKEFWTNADTVYDKVPTMRICDCGEKFIAKYTVIDKKICY